MDILTFFSLIIHYFGGWAEGQRSYAFKRIYRWASHQWCKVSIGVGPTTSTSSQISVMKFWSMKFVNHAEDFYSYDNLSYFYRISFPHFISWIIRLVSNNQMQQDRQWLHFIQDRTLLFMGCYELISLDLMRLSSSVWIWWDGSTSLFLNLSLYLILCSSFSLSLWFGTGLDRIKLNEIEVNRIEAGRERAS